MAMYAENCIAVAVQRINHSTTVPRSTPAFPALRPDNRSVLFPFVDLDTQNKEVM